MKKSIKILITVLCLIIVGLITFIVVDKVINKKAEDSTQNINSTVENESKKENIDSKTPVNGKYERIDETKRTTGYINITNSTNESFSFKIDATKVIGQDIERAIANGAVNMGGTYGVAKKVTDGTYEYIPEEDDELMESFDGEYKITFEVKEDNKVEIKEIFDKSKHNQGPYSGGDVLFDGVYELVANDTQDTVKIDKDATTDSKNTNQSDYANEYLKIINEYEAEYLDIKYDLIYFNDDNIPDLVVDATGGWVSLYMYEDGKVYNLMDHEGYGIGGSKYYDYQEKNGNVYNYGNGYAGAIRCDTYYILNSNHEFDTLSYTGKGADIESTDPSYAEIQEELEKYGGYYYNEQKISEDEYNKKLKEFSISTDEDSYKQLTGTKTSEEIKQKLQ